MLLGELLPTAGLLGTEFARGIGWTKTRLNALTKKERGITVDAALDVAEVLGTSARPRMNLQAKYDLAQAEKRRDAARERVSSGRDFAGNAGVLRATTDSARVASRELRSWMREYRISWPGREWEPSDKCLLG
jgi:addiction module HigA family antidote